MCVCAACRFQFINVNNGRVLRLFFVLFSIIHVALVLSISLSLSAFTPFSSPTFILSLLFCFCCCCCKFFYFIHSVLVFAYLCTIFPFHSDNRLSMVAFYFYLLSALVPSAASSTCPCIALFGKTIIRISLSGNHIYVKWYRCIPCILHSIHIRSMPTTVFILHLFSCIIHENVE